MTQSNLKSTRAATDTRNIHESTRRYHAPGFHGWAVWTNQVQAITHCGDENKVTQGFSMWCCVPTGGGVGKVRVIRGLILGTMVAYLRVEACLWKGEVTSHLVGSFLSGSHSGFTICRKASEERSWECCLSCLSLWSVSCRYSSGRAAALSSFLRSDRIWQVDWLALRIKCRVQRFITNWFIWAV